jgi:hypothetical protein
VNSDALAFSQSSPCIFGLLKILSQPKCSVTVGGGESYGVLAKREGHLCGVTTNLDVDNSESFEHFKNSSLERLLILSSCQAIWLSVDVSNLGRDHLLCNENTRAGWED